MATCPKGHESATTDYCDVCGALMAAVTGMSGTAAPAPAVPEFTPETTGTPNPESGPGRSSCPVCGTAQAGRFCEEDGYDFLLAPPTEQGASSARPVNPVASADPVGSRGGGPQLTPDASPEPGSVSAPGAWQVVLGVDRAYFEAITAAGGADADGLSFPRFVAERRFTLDGNQLLIGRRSRSRGVHPDIDLAGPPEDPGVSHLHALLVAQAGRWAVVDLASANGTYLNDPSAHPIEPNTPVPVSDGDRIFLGAWTSLTIQQSG